MNVESKRTDEPQKRNGGDAVILRPAPIMLVGFHQRCNNEDDADEVPENHNWHSVVGMCVIYPL